MFDNFARATAVWLGKPIAFILSVVGVLAWAVTGPMFDYSDTWQLIINTSTTVVTFWMVFVIQNTQNRDATAMHVKMDELLKVSKDARNELISLEDEPADKIQQEKKGMQQ